MKKIAKTVSVLFAPALSMTDLPKSSAVEVRPTIFEPLSSRNNILAADLEDERISTSCLSPTFVLGFMGFLCFFVFAILQLNTNIAIVSMVDWVITAEEAKFTGQCNYGDRNEALNRNRTAEFGWSQLEQSNILAIYFIGLASTQLLGGSLAEKFSAKMVTFVGILATTFCTFCTPLVARVDIQFLYWLQVLKGAGHGLVIPALTVLIGKWVPPSRRTIFLIVLAIGFPLGSCISVMFVGYLCTIKFMNGWPSAFYFTGIISASWCAVWFILIYDTPFDHPWIPQQEISRYMRLKNKGIIYMKQPPRPIGQMLKSLAVWSYILVGFTLFWAINFFGVLMPSFMGAVLHYSIENNGLLCALPHFVLAITMALSGFSHYCLQNQKMISKTTVNKIFVTLGLGGFSICMIGLSTANCDRMANVALLTAALGFSGIALPAIIALPEYLSPKFAGTIGALQTSFGSLSGFLIPYFIGLSETHYRIVTVWHVIFYVSAGIGLVTVIFYIVFGKSEIQRWNYSEYEKTSKDATRTEENTTPTNAETPRSGARMMS